ncbi:dimethylarginine dimethylaminohydrolase family protein [Actinomadura monticuli]|uniref:Arginine deiminase family protein n=1 Tax=Actinomadura monticuli TaxID=3097367 RepID=A0ABV4Q4L2_9ACTN
MNATGSDRYPSTLGGRGWAGRPATHGGDVSAGVIWLRCGQRSETGALRRVLLARPPRSLGLIEDHARALVLDRVDVAAMRAQTDDIAASYERNGVTVHVADVPETAPPNIVFMRDLFFMTADGAVLGRMASAARSGEERHAAAALAGLGVPILRTVAGAATFEGADALWLAPDSVVVGTGFRTNLAAVRQLREVLREQGVRVRMVPLPAGVQHLLGVVVPLGRGLAAVHSAAAGAGLRTILRAHGLTPVEIPPCPDLLDARGMNLVPLEPGRVLMPAGAPVVRDALAAEGVHTEEVAIGEYVKAAGGIGCLTGILCRDGETERGASPGQG